jgi:hypothetical protein
VTRKGIKKRDLSDVELREILSDLLPLVRMDHVLPPSSDVLNQAIRRGLVSNQRQYIALEKSLNSHIYIYTLFEYTFHFCFDAKIVKQYLFCVERSEIINVLYDP